MSLQVNQFSESRPPESPLPPIQERLCAAIAAGKSQDPIGTATPVDRVLTVEIPMPWTRRGMDADPEGSIPEQVAAVQRRVRATAGSQSDGLLPPGRVYGVLPDPEWSSSHQRRLLVAERQAMSGSYEMSEYLFPTDSPQIPQFVEAFLSRPDDLDRFANFRVERPDVVDFLVCTHGRRDACCAKFGMPLHKQARMAGRAIRAWRAMHFGGHRYAPTAWEFPSGYKWGFLTEGPASEVLGRGDVEVAARHLRGWSGASREVQPLDRVGLAQFGWEWLGFSRRGRILDAGPRTWRVRLDFESPGGEKGAFEGQVGVTRRLRSVGCGAQWGEKDSLVDELELVSHQRVPPDIPGGA